MNTQTKITEKNKIQTLFRLAEELAALHEVLGSPRGDYFHLRILQVLETERSLEELEQLKLDAHLDEIRRHLNKLLGFRLIGEHSANGRTLYKRTDAGEKVVNALRALGRRIGEEATFKIFRANLGVNSIRLFLRVYGSKNGVTFERPEIVLTPTEMGKIALFLPHSLEGIAAVDKLSDAEILVYSEERDIKVPAQKARAFCRYLLDLFAIVAETYSGNGSLPSKLHSPDDS